MGRIQTGVDRLVAIVKEKQKVSVSEAASSLGVSKVIIQEWADFLEEEGIVEIKYSLSNTFLIDKKLTKNEAAAKERQFQQQRETFVSKVDQSLGAIETESASFERFRKDFQSLKSDLGKSLQSVQEELGKLRLFEKQKTRTVKNVHTERARLAKEEAAADAAIKRQYKQYHAVLHEISSQEKNLFAHKQSVHDLMKSAAHVKDKISEYEKLLISLNARVKKETGAIGAHSKTIKLMHKSLRQVRSELKSVESSRLKPLVELRAKHEKSIKELEHKILEKARAERAHSKNPAGAPVRARKKLEEFFKRKKTVEHLLEAIEHDKKELITELSQLEHKAEAYRVSKNSAKLDELKKRLKELDAGKEKLHSHIQSFLKTLH